MIVKFKHGEYNYRYNSAELHWIFKEVSKNCYEKFCPVLTDVQSHLEKLPKEASVSILRSIVHGYTHGYFEGETNKLRDIRRVLGVNCT